MAHTTKHPVKVFLKDNALSLVMFGLFFVFLIGLSVTGYLHENEELKNHHQQATTYTSYVVSGEFAEAVFENWESEFLQMGALVILTIFLYQKGSADSKKLRGKEDVDRAPHHAILHARNWAERGRAIGEVLYANSLGLALFGIFIISFILHAVGGTSAFNEEAMWHNEPQLSVMQYIASSRFWYESFQNWQSEFLAVGSLLVLSVFLRQQGSPESKPVDESNSKTGD